MPRSRSCCGSSVWTPPDVVRLDPGQLEGHLRRGLAPAYLLCGDEPLQLGEAADAIRRKAREAGYAERVVLDADGQFDWGRLTGEVASLSLFAARRVIDLRLPGGKPGRDGGTVLRDTLAALDDANLLLVSTGKLDGSAYKSAWFKAFDERGVVVQSQAVGLGELPRWVGRRAAAKGMTLDEEAAAVIAERTEGNLLACDQELQKLLLVCGPRPLDAAEVVAAVGESARHDFFQLADAALAGDPARIGRIAAHLRGEGTPLPLVLWGLGQDIRALCSMAHGGGVPQRPPAGLTGGPRVWQRRRPLFEAAVRRHSLTALLGLLEQLGTADRAAKGRARALDPWVTVERYCLALAGVAGFAAGRAER